jgi:hypothetical protein
MTNRETLLTEIEKLPQAIKDELHARVIIHREDFLDDDDQDGFDLCDALDDLVSFLRGYDRRGQG